jgi:hypothetical protein
MKPTQPAFPKLPDLETEADARAEDRKRAIGLLERAERRQLEESPPGFTLVVPEMLVANLLTLQDVYPDKWFPNLASSAQMRLIRGNIATSLLDISSAYSGVEKRCVTIIPPAARFTIDELEKESPRRLIDRIRVQLDRRGARSAGGFIFGGLHGEFEPQSKTFLLHMHLGAFGEMVEVIDGLRGSRCYKPTPEVAQPIRSVRVGDPARQFTYLLQSWWPARWVGPVGNDRTVRRARTKCRIPEPEHSRLLMWFHQQSLRDLTLVIGARVNSTGVVRMNPKDQRAGTRL